MSTNKTAIDDQKLPHLQQAVTPAVMARAFETLFQQEYPDQGLTVRRCHVGRVYHKPGRECSINYRVAGTDRAGQPFEQWFHATVLAHVEQLAQRQESSLAGVAHHDFWKPITLWPDFVMVLHAFPYDPKLPRLGQLMAPDFVKATVQTYRERFGVPDGWTCVDASCRRIKYRPGKRCILKYDVRLSNAQGDTRQITFFGKTYNDATSRYVYDALARICASPACSSDRLTIPPPILHHDEAHTYWQHAWEGQDFSRLMHQHGWERLPDTGLLPKIATMIATLHQIDLGALPLQQGPLPAQVLANAREDVAKILAFLPEQRAVFHGILERLIALMPTTGSTVPQATIHGSFKAAQLLCRGDQVAMVDFDAVASGDPLYDMAEFIASLVYLRVSDGVAAASIDRSVDLLWQSYNEQVPWFGQRHRLAWYIVAFLLGKVHASLKRLEAQSMKDLGAALMVIETWLQRAQKTSSG